MNVSIQTLCNLRYNCAITETSLHLQERNIKMLIVEHSFSVILLYSGTHVIYKSV